MEQKTDTRFGFRGATLVKFRQCHNFFKNLFRDYNYENIRNVLEYKKKS